MRKDKSIILSVMVSFIMGAALVSCNSSDSPAAPTKPTINFHITNPINGDTLAWGTAVTIIWTLPANGSIDSVLVYRKPQNQTSFMVLNQYSPVVAPADSFQWNTGSDVPAGMTEKIQIRNKADSTQFDEITIHIKG
jgi:hypothetical protein